MTKIKVGDRVKYLTAGDEVTVFAINDARGWFQPFENAPWHSLKFVELVEPLRTKLIPFQASQWTPEQKVVTRIEHNPVRILCVDADDDDFPVVGLIENRFRGAWTKTGFFRLDEIEDQNDLMVVVEPKTRTLYGYWNDTKKTSFTYESESERDRWFQHHGLDTEIRIKFQTEIEL